MRAAMSGGETRWRCRGWIFGGRGEGRVGRRGGARGGIAFFLRRLGELVLRAEGGWVGGIESVPFASDLGDIACWNAAP